MGKRLAFGLALVFLAGASALASSPGPATIRYTYAERFELEIWTGPSSTPIDAYGGNGGDVLVSIAKTGNGSYAVNQRLHDANGTGTLDSTYALVRRGNRTAQTLLADIETFRSKGFSQRTIDTYPAGKIAFMVPLVPHDNWNGTARDLSSASTVQTIPSPFAEQESTDTAADGSYTSQTSATGFASTTDMRQY